VCRFYDAISLLMKSALKSKHLLTKLTMTLVHSDIWERILYYYINSIGFFFTSDFRDRVFLLIFLYVYAVICNVD